MKKLLTLLMALVMVFALAAPAMAWVGWDAPEPVEEEDELLDDFELSGIRLEYFESSSATFSWIRTYYAEYSPDNKGVVEGTHIRGYFSLTLPAYSDVPSEVKGQISNMAVNITSTNMQISRVEVYRSVAGGDRETVNDYTVNDTKLKYSMGSSSFNSTKKVCYEFMVTGYSKAAKDVTLTAKLGINQSAFNSANTYTFTTAKGVKYTVVHEGNYYLITSSATDGTVRFTVDSNNKVTDIAVSLDTGTRKANVITQISASDYKAYDQDNKDQKDNNIAQIQAYQRAIVKKHYALIDKDAINIEAELVKLGVDGIEAAYNNIAAGLGLPKMYYATNYTDIDTDNNGKADDVNPDYANGVLYYLYINGYDVIFYTPIVKYRDIADFVVTSGGLYDVTLSGIKYGINEGRSDIMRVRDYYYATTNADTAKTVFTRLATTQDLGYQDYAAAVADISLGAVGQSGALSYADAVAAKNDVDFYQVPSNSINAAIIGPGQSAHASYLKIFQEVLGVLGFEWDGTTKYMYEDKFVELFGANVSISNTLTWKAYTADLIVPDGTEPPQTGDSASIVGFVMIALAVLAAGAVVIKKVRA